MNLPCKCLLFLLSIAALRAADKDKAKFTPGPISEYENRQTIDQVTVAARPYTTEEQAKAPFGKLHPYRHGVLPILLVIQNTGAQTLALDRMKVEYILPDRRHVESTPAADVRFLSAPDRPGMVTGPIPGGKPRISRKKNPLDAWEIEGRAFAARMLPAGETASGFFYFQAPFRPGSALYVTGIREASTGKELFYFELPLQ